MNITLRAQIEELTDLLQKVEDHRHEEIMAVLRLLDAHGRAALPEAVQTHCARQMAVNEQG